MDQLIHLLVAIVIFAAVAGGAWWICVKFKAPDMVFWIVGVILLIFLFYYAAQQLGMAAGTGSYPARR